MAFLTFIIRFSLLDDNGIRKTKVRFIIPYCGYDISSGYSFSIDKTKTTAPEKAGSPVSFKLLKIFTRVVYTFTSLFNWDGQQNGSKVSHFLAAVAALWVL